MVTGTKSGRDLDFQTIEFFSLIKDERAFCRIIDLYSKFDFILKLKQVLVY